MNKYIVPSIVIILILGAAVAIAAKKIQTANDNKAHAMASPTESAMMMDDSGKMSK